MKVKLVGARSFSCPPKGIMTPITLNQVMDVGSADAKYFLGLTYRDALNNEHHLFSDDPDAEATYIPVVEDRTLEEALAEQKEASIKKLEADAKVNAAQKVRNKGGKAPADVAAEEPGPDDGGEAAKAEAPAEEPAEEPAPKPAARTRRKATAKKA